MYKYSFIILSIFFSLKASAEILHANMECPQKNCAKTTMVFVGNEASQVAEASPLSQPLMSSEKPQNKKDLFASIKPKDTSKDLSKLVKKGQIPTYIDLLVRSSQGID